MKTVLGIITAKKRTDRWKKRQTDRKKMTLGRQNRAKKDGKHKQNVFF